MKFVHKERACLRTRALINEKRERKNASDEAMDVTKLAKKIQKGHYSHEVKDVLKPSLSELREPTTSAKRRSKKGGKVTMADRISIVHQVLVNHQLQSQVGKDHGITPGAVSRIVAEFRKSDSVFGSRLKAREEKADRKLLIEEHVRRELSEHSFIDSSEVLSRKLFEQGTCQTTPSEVRAVLKGPMQLRYRSVKPVNPHCNSERCLVLR